MGALKLLPLGLALAARGHAQSSPPVLDVSRLVSRHDSFAVRVQGVQIGFIRNTLETGPAGFHYIEQSRIEGLVDQTTTLELDRAGEMRRVTQQGTVQGQSASIEVEYGNGRVHGKASTAGPLGPKTLAIDTTVPAGTFDDNAIQSILPALALAPGASWSIGVFTAAANEFRSTSLKVAGTETVAAAAGDSVATYRVEWSGVVQPTTFWVSTALPHRVVRIGIAGAPIEIVRVTSR